MLSGTVVSLLHLTALVRMLTLARPLANNGMQALLQVSHHVYLLALYTDFADSMACIKPMAGCDQVRGAFRY